MGSLRQNANFLEESHSFTIFLFHGKDCHKNPQRHHTSFVFRWMILQHFLRSVTATVDYVIDPKDLSMDEMLWLTNTAHSNLLSDTWQNKKNQFA